MILFIRLLTFIPISNASLIIGRHHPITPSSFDQFKPGDVLVLVKRPVALEIHGIIAVEPYI